MGELAGGGSVAVAVGVGVTTFPLNDFHSYSPSLCIKVTPLKYLLKLISIFLRPVTKMLSPTNKYNLGVG